MLAPGSGPLVHEELGMHFIGYRYVELHPTFKPVPLDCENRESIPSLLDDDGIDLHRQQSPSNRIS